MKFCTKCGASMDDDARFCTSCGAVVEDIPQTPQMDQPIPPQMEQPVPPRMEQPQTPQQPDSNYYAADAQANAGYRPPTYNPTPQPQRTLVFGRLSFIFGLIGLIMSGLFGIIGLFTAGIVGIYCWFGICLGIAGLIFGIIGKKKNPDDSKARTGFLLSLIAIIAGFVLFIIGIIIMVNTIGSNSWY